MNKTIKYGCIATTSAATSNARFDTNITEDLEGLLRDLFVLLAITLYNHIGRQLVGARPYFFGQTKWGFGHRFRRYS